MSEGTSIPTIVSKLLELIGNRIGDSAKVIDQVPTQVVDMIASTGRPAVIYPSPVVEITYAIETMNAFQLRITEEFSIGVVCEVSAQAANISLDDARHECSNLAYAVLTTIARKPDLGLPDDSEHQVFEILPASATYVNGAIGDSAVAVGVRHEIILRCKTRLILLQ